MLRVTSTLLVVLLTGGGWLDARAQTSDQVLVVQQGQQQSLSYKNLAGASVGSIHVAHIQRMKPNEVIIFGAGPGETSLELTQRDGQKKKLLVRVLSTTQFEAQASLSSVTPPRAMPSAGVPSGVAGGKVPKEGEATAPAAEMTSTEPPASPITATASAPSPRRAPVRPGRSKMSRLEISAETTFQSDREKVRVVSSELLNPKKLQEAVQADSGEKLATSSEREQTITVSRSSVVTPISIRYEINDRSSVTLILPYVRRQDEIGVEGGSVKTRGQGLGDVQLRFEKTQPRLRNTAWDGSIEFDLGIPTGKSIYNLGKNQSPLGIGHYEIGGLVGVRRIFDPVSFNASLGVIYDVPRTVQGTRIAPGLGYSAQTGIGFALSDKWVLSEQMSYTRRPNVFLSSPTDAQTVSTDQSYLSHSLIRSVRGGGSLRVNFTIGLNPASSDRGFGISYTLRGKDKKQQ